MNYALAEPKHGPPFFSQLRRTIERKMGGIMPVKQLQALLKQPGIKATTEVERP